MLQVMEMVAAGITPPNVRVGTGLGVGWGWGWGPGQLRAAPACACARADCVWGRGEAASQGTPWAWRAGGWVGGWVDAQHGLHQLRQNVPLPIYLHGLSHCSV